MTAAIPALALAWRLSEPCDTCAGCRRRLQAEMSLMAVENSLFAAAMLLTPDSKGYYTGLDAIMAGRDQVREDLFDDPLSLQCDNLTMVVEE